MSISSQVLLDIAAERSRQITAEGFDATHDDGTAGGALALAGSCYAMHAAITITEDQDNSTTSAARRAIRNLWPWSEHWWKPGGKRRDLVKAAALIVAEIERMDRAAK